MGKGIQRANSLLHNLFLPSNRAQHPWADRLWTFGVYLSGLALWGIFFQGGNFPTSFQDWSDIAVPRLLFLKDALTRGLLPLHISALSALGGVTDRYLAVPNTLFSPQIVLLGILDAGHFVLANQLLMYSIGFLGLARLKRKFGLSPLAFAALFLLFNFNGHIVSHLSVGHTSWEGYFFFPWFALLVIELLEGDRSWAWVAKVSLLMLGVFLQGAFHQFIWLLIFLSILAVTSWKHILPLAKAGVFTVLLALFRLLPPAQLLGQFNQAYTYMGGYNTLGDMWKSLVSFQGPGSYWSSAYSTVPVGTWEIDLYVGAAGAVFILFFALWGWVRRRDGSARYAELILPILGLVALSLGDVFKVLHDSPIPMLHGERVASRMISVPFTFLVILAVVEFQRWLNRRRWPLPLQAAQVGYLGWIGANLWHHFQTWETASAAPAFASTPVVVSAWYAANHPDPGYFRLLAVGLVGTGAGLGLLAFLVWKEARQARMAPAAERTARRLVPGRRPGAVWRPARAADSRQHGAWVRAEPIRVSRARELATVETRVRETGARRRPAPPRSRWQNPG